MEETVAVVVEEEEEPEEDELSDYEQALITFATEAFEASQMLCPVRTGALVRSSWLKVVPGDVGFGYSASYAEVVERGKGMPGEKGYFEGRRYCEGALDEVEPRFGDFLLDALQREYDVEEVSAVVE